ncbi:MAG: SPOR domain-containing protein [Methylococcaceae bacterium]|nr:SPOR domain-containing protein [Methylococcaceae bacterium]MDP3902778.1 SPOR domain-containing protein [Methylococcaceae bacterium]
MARDYKHSGQGKRHSKRGYYDGPQSISLWKWMLITALIISFVVFLVYLRSGPKQAQPDSQAVTQAIPVPPTPEKTVVKPEVKVEPGPAIPRFDFYTILPEKEVVVPDYEIGTRTREERVGQGKESSYIVQAGSFKEFKDADNMKAKLALMGIESRVEKAKVGDATWYRVKMGPLSKMSSVSSIRVRLRQNGIDVVVTEAGH